jgi:hypothetical protein
MQISEQDVIKRATDLYGEDRLKWKFKCPHCQKVQSGESVIEQQKQGILSMRHGQLKHGDPLNPDSECYSSQCNWVAYGLFTSNIIVIRDPTKEFNPRGHNDEKEGVHVISLSNTGNQNCYFIFPLADDKEMLAAAGLKVNVNG